jgi:Ca2+-binding EF-hand superfamily protein
LHKVARDVAESAAEYTENNDFRSENVIGAAVVCFWSLLIWLFFLPLFHYRLVPWMKSWEDMHDITLREYMERAEESYPTPFTCFEVLDGDGDKNSTQKEFRAGSETFKRQPFRYPAEMIPIFKAIDLNGDGAIQDYEFFKSTPAGVDFKWRINITDLKMRARLSFGYLDSYFQEAMDLDSNGKVTEEEWMNAAMLLVPPVPREDAKALFKVADKDGNGVLEPREWVAYAVPGNFTFPTVLPKGVDHTGANVIHAVQAALKVCLALLPTSDLLSVSGVRETPSSRRLQPSLPMLGSGNGTSVSLDIVFNILTGTKQRVQVLEVAASKLPDMCFRSAFKYSLIHGGGSTSGPPVTTSRQVVVPGPVSDAELEEYNNIPCIIQGRTNVWFTHTKAAGEAIRRDEIRNALVWVVEASLLDAGKEKMKVEAEETLVHEAIRKPGSANHSAVFLWSGDVKQCGKFQRRLKDNGARFVQALSDGIEQKHFPELAAAHIHSWSRLTAAYYGSLAAHAPRGPYLNQHNGMFKGARNDTGTLPYVSKPHAETD